MQLKRKFIVPAVGLLAVAGIGTGVAVAQSRPGPDTSNPPADSTQVEPGDQPDEHDDADAKDEKGDTEEKDGKEEKEKDGKEANEANEAPGTESTTAPR